MSKSVLEREDNVENKLEKRFVYLALVSASFMLGYLFGNYPDHRDILDVIALVLICTMVVMVFRYAIQLEDILTGKRKIKEDRQGTGSYSDTGSSLTTEPSQ